MGTPAPGNGGSSEGAATQEPTERRKGAATQKPTFEMRNSRNNLGARGGDPRTLANTRTFRKRFTPPAARGGIQILGGGIVEVKEQAQSVFLEGFLFEFFLKFALY